MVDRTKTEYLIGCIKRAGNGYGDSEWKEETIARLKRLDELRGWKKEFSATIKLLYLPYEWGRWEAEVAIYGEPPMILYAHNLRHLFYKTEDMGTWDRRNSESLHERCIRAAGAKDEIEFEEDREKDLD